MGQAAFVVRDERCPFDEHNAALRHHIDRSAVSNIHLLVAGVDDMAALEAFGDHRVVGHGELDEQAVGIVLIKEGREIERTDWSNSASTISRLRL
jgi:hypothetical protein